MPSLLFLLPYCAYAPHPTSVTAPALPLWPNPAVAHQARGTGPWLPLLPYMFSTPALLSRYGNPTEDRRSSKGANVPAICVLRFDLLHLEVCEVVEVDNVVQGWIVPRREQLCLGSSGEVSSPFAYTQEPRLLTECISSWYL